MHGQPTGVYRDHSLIRRVERTLRLSRLEVLIEGTWPYRAASVEDAKEEVGARYSVVAGNLRGAWYNVIPRRYCKREKGCALVCYCLCDVRATLILGDLRGTTSLRTCPANTASRPMEQPAQSPAHSFRTPLAAPRGLVSVRGTFHVAIRFNREANLEDRQRAASFAPITSPKY